MFVCKHIETIEYVKICLLFKKNTNFPGEELENSQDSECEFFMVLFLYIFIYKFSGYFLYMIQNI